MSNLSLATPHKTGHFESGTHTCNANDFALFITTAGTVSSTRDVMHRGFEMAFKHMMSKRFDADPNSQWRNVVAGISEDTERVNFAGYIILNDVSDVLWRYFRPFYAHLTAQYEKETGPIEWEDPRHHVTKDMFNWYLRSYEEWIPGHVLASRKAKLVRV